MRDKDCRGVSTIGVACVGLVAVMGLAACEQRQPPMESKQEAPAPKVEATPTGEAKMGMPATETSTVLTAPESSAGRTENKEGITHAQQGHWDVAESHFRKALAADPTLAEAHFNLGLAFDKLDRHDEAKAAFEKAVELAPNNSMITESPVVKKHMST